MPQHKPELDKEIARGALDAKEMGHLADNRDADETLDKPAHYRRRNKRGHPAEAQRAEQQKKGADQDREGGGERVEFRRPLGRDRTDGQRRDQAGRGIRADHQQARGAEERIGDQRRDDRVEAHDRRHPDNPGIGHALRHHDRPDCDPGHRIGQEPAAPIARRPGENGQEARYHGCGCGRPRRSASSNVTRRATVIAR